MGLLAALVLAGCGGGSGSSSGRQASPPPPPPGTTNEVGPLRLEMTTNRTVYSKGQPVNVQLRVTNISSERVTLYYTTTGGEYDWSVDYKGASVSTPYYTVGVTVNSQVVYEPGQARTYDLSWDQSASILDQTTKNSYLNPDGKAIPGDYQINAWLYANLTGYGNTISTTADGRTALITAPLTIRIE